jgi:thioredoxin
MWARSRKGGSGTMRHMRRGVCQTLAPEAMSGTSLLCGRFSVGPCRLIAPIIDELAVEYKDKLKCVKLNTDESPNVASEYGIRSIPTIMIFKGSKKMETIIGAVPKSTIVQTVEKYL